MSKANTTFGTNIVRVEFKYLLDAFIMIYFYSFWDDHTELSLETSIIDLPNATLVYIIEKKSEQAFSKSIIQIHVRRNRV